ncbi:dolichyl-phosphate-mannose--protein mannosyltransferase [Leptospira bouyouniensis]|uniref:Dolichyl-phosphate-mannose--protein mannosyltransferase n=1 Tax=Leptospira bouyouniensis TaxID=2484911 RepID=A0A7I0IMU2_9LEPT|nr:dolichyl-phosphate-mannose--protein mannosyltransferase [Leptospira bouyouniensis]TGL04516.1 dolichyl-phosphate-mannose--protein mannosyltransferase [Leptospira bouyouniensis]
MDLNLTKFSSRAKLFCIVTLCFGLGSFLRLYQLDRQSLWGDELFSVYASSIDSWSEFTNVISADPHPPLFQILLKFWLKIPLENKELLAKFFPLSFSLINLFIVWFLSGHLNSKVRLLFLFLITTSPGAIYYAQEVRSYSLLLTFSTMLLLLLTKLRNPIIQQKGVLVSFFIITVLISYVHLFGFILAGFLLLSLFISNSISTRKISFIFLTFGILLLLFYLPFLIHLKQAGKIETAGWIPPPDYVLYFGYFNLFSSVSMKHIIWTLVFPLVIFTFLCIRKIYMYIQKKLRFEFDSAGFYLLISFLILLITSIFSYFIPISTSRNWIITLPLVYYFVSKELSSFKYSNYLIILILICLFFSFLNLKKNFYISFKEDWRGATQVIIKNCQTSAVFSDAFPEFFNLYLSWNHEKNVHVDWNHQLENVTQSSFCLISRKLGGNNLNVKVKDDYQFDRSDEVLGFEIKKYKKKL